MDLKAVPTPTVTLLREPCLCPKTVTRSQVCPVRGEQRQTQGTFPITSAGQRPRAGAGQVKSHPAATQRTLQGPGLWED